MHLYLSHLSRHKEVKLHNILQCFCLSFSTAETFDLWCVYSIKQLNESHSRPASAAALWLKGVFISFQLQTCKQIYCRSEEKKRVVKKKVLCNVASILAPDILGTFDVSYSNERSTYCTVTPKTLPYKISKQMSCAFKHLFSSVFLLNVF